MGAVWYAEHLLLNSPVAVKLIEASIAKDPNALARFLREAQSAAALRSPHVVQILDYGVDDGSPYIVMEVLEGESLADRLRRLGRLSVQETTRIITHMARAMMRAHELGIVHRDLKPDNVFIVQNDEDEIAKVLDFGIAKSAANELGASTSAQTRTGAVLGTPYYMSPEQAEGMRSIDHRTDLWAFGVIACECLTGRRPFEAETLGGLLLAICARPLPVPSQLGAVPEGFDAWFGRACSRDVNERYASARQLAQDLQKLCERSTSGTVGLPVRLATLEHPGFGHEQFARSGEGLSSTLGAPQSSEVEAFKPSGARRKLAMVAAAGAGALTLGLFAWGYATTPAPAMLSSARAPVTSVAPPVPASREHVSGPSPAGAENLVVTPIAPPSAGAEDADAPPQKRSYPPSIAKSKRPKTPKVPSASPAAEKAPVAAPMAEPKVDLGI